MLIGLPVTTALSNSGMRCVSGSCSSPSPDSGSDPHALKYRSTILRKPRYGSSQFRIFSTITFDSPYGLTGSNGESSGIGTTWGVPYTAAVEEKTIRFTLVCTMAVNNDSVPPTLLEKYSSGFW